YMAYRFIFEFVVPVTKTANQLKRKMSEMQQNQAFQQQHHAASPAPEAKSASSAPKRDDYIEFEEVK
ncbi:MAG: hypothetical protein WCP74_14200, partial [Sphingobacteriia bacterium]